MIGASDLLLRLGMELETIGRHVFIFGMVLETSRAKTEEIKLSQKKDFEDRTVKISRKPRRFTKPISFWRVK